MGIAFEGDFTVPASPDWVIARTGGPIVARALMEQFAQRLREQLVTSATATSAQPVTEPVAESISQFIPPAPSTAPALAGLRVETLLWSVLRRWLRQLIGRRPS